MTTLILVRHGETDWNAARRIQGSTDIRLNANGRAQARDAAAALRVLVGESAAMLVASDLSRAAETARIIGEELGLGEPVSYAGLRERHYGTAEGLTDTEYIARFGSWDRDEIAGAEPRPQLRRRALAAVRTVVADARRRHAPADVPVIAVSHGALIGELIRHASGDSLPLPGTRIANGSAHTFQVSRDHLRLLEVTRA